MKLLRLSDVDVRGKRVFIRADLNVPKDDAGNAAPRNALPRLLREVEPPVAAESFRHLACFAGNAELRL